MPCMCGDPYCHSCGPAQGNERCPMCGKWSADGGCDDPEKCEDRSVEFGDALDRDIREAEGLPEKENRT